MRAPLVTLIAAVSQDGFISRGRGVPWDSPADRAHFRAFTKDKWLLLGRTTFEEMRGWFAGHMPLVLSRDPGFRPDPPGRRIESVEEGIDLAAAAGAEELVVCGGGGAYAAAMPFARRLVITRVAERLERGVPFPAIDPDIWEKTDTTQLPGSEDAPRLEIEWYERRC